METRSEVQVPLQVLTLLVGEGVTIEDILEQINF